MQRETLSLSQQVAPVEQDLDQLTGNANDVKLSTLSPFQFPQQNTIMDRTNTAFVTQNCL